MTRASEYMKKLSFDLSVTINDGLSVSNVVNTYGQSVVGLIIPSTLTGTQITIQSSISATGTFYNMYNTEGNQMVITFGGQGWYQLLASDLTSAQYIKLVSNVAQSGSDCDITLIARAL